jgi:hypothetical protein
MIPPALRFPKRITLLHSPSGQYVQALVVELTASMIRQKMGARWWTGSAIDTAQAEREIDRHWDWTQQEIERDGTIIASRKLAILTGDGAVQGTMMISTAPVQCQLDTGAAALFVELLFAAPWNRPWVRIDRTEQFRGVGVQLMRTAAMLSIEAGLQGRLKLDASPASIEWYRKRGLLEVKTHRIVYEGVEYTPMELPANRVSLLLPEVED